MGTRDKLAIQRTKLANERTFLSYIRTSIVFFAGGATLLKVESHDTFYVVIALLFLVSGAILITLGFYLFRKNRRILLPSDRQAENFSGSAVE